MYIYHQALTAQISCSGSSRFSRSPKGKVDRWPMSPKSHVIRLMPSPAGKCGRGCVWNNWSDNASPHQLVRLCLSSAVVLAWGWGGRLEEPAKNRECGMNRIVGEKQRARRWGTGWIMHCCRWEKMRGLWTRGGGGGTELWFLMRLDWRTTTAS